MIVWYTDIKYKVIQQKSPRVLIYSKLNFLYYKTLQRIVPTCGFIEKTNMIDTTKTLQRIVPACRFIKQVIEYTTKTLHQIVATCRFL